MAGRNLSILILCLLVISCLLCALPSVGRADERGRTPIQATVSVQSSVAAQDRSGGTARGNAAPQDQSNVGGPSAWVMVRTIEASGGIARPVSSSVSVPKIDPRLFDISEKLRKLHFTNFRLLSSQTQVVPLMKKGKLALVNGDNLILRPLLVSPERVSLWLKWKDAQGMEILDTRMHFDPGESMLTGTDHSEQSGVILAIEVKPGQ